MTNTMTNNARAGKGDYKPALDGVRAVAIGSVLAAHYAPGSQVIHPAGLVGVRLFFVLSGFLITGILIGAKQAAGAAGQPTLRTMRQFYIRRVLRIFPVCYLTLAIVLALGLEFPFSAKASLGLFASNWWMSIRNEGLGFASPYWSLAVEEQYYLVWPWVVLLFTRLRGIAITMILAGWCIRLALAARGESMWLVVSTPASVEALGMGSLLAILRYSGDAKAVSRLAGAAGVIGVPLMAASFVRVAMKWHTGLPGALDTEGFYLAAGLIAFWAVERCDRNAPGVIWNMLASRPMVYVGRISYGLYLYHMIVYRGTDLLLQHLGVRWDASPKLRVLGMLVASIVIADLSWRFFEKPINDFKRRFPYIERRRAGAALAE